MESNGLNGDLTEAEKQGDPIMLSGSDACYQDRTTHGKSAGNIAIREMKDALFASGLETETRGQGFSGILARCKCLFGFRVYSLFNSECRPAVLSGIQLACGPLGPKSK